MKETILGIDQAFAVEHGLDIVDAVLISTITDKLKSKNTEKREINGEKYVWINYRSLLEWLPILGVKKRALALRLDRLVEKGFLKKHIKREEGNYTFFALCHSNSKPVSTEVQRVCQSNDNPMSTELHTKSNRDKDTEIREKEKDNTKVLSKKKVGDFDAAFTEFSAKCRKDEQLAYSLAPYRVVNLDAMLEEFMRHIRKSANMGDFLKNGYVRNRLWMLRSVPFLDMSGATGISLGYGEYLKNGKRIYKNRNGKEIEVPITAPPRRQGTIWYKEQGRWGPDI